MPTPAIWPPRLVTKNDNKYKEKELEFLFDIVWYFVHWQLFDEDDNPSCNCQIHEMARYSSYVPISSPWVQLEAWRAP